jgi:hypothetical protein
MKKCPFARLNENEPVTTAATAKRYATNAVASLTRLSPSKIVTMRHCAALAILLLSLDVLAVLLGYRYIGSRVVSEGRHVYWYWDSDFFQVDASGSSFVARMYARNLELDKEVNYVAVVRCDSRTYRPVGSKDAYEAIENGDPIFTVWRAGCDAGRAVSLALRNERLHGADTKTRNAGARNRSGAGAQFLLPPPSVPPTGRNAPAAPSAADNRTDERRVDSCIRFALSTVSQVGDAAITNTCRFAVEVVYCYKGGGGGTFDCPSPPRRMRADSLGPGATHQLPEYKRGSNTGIALVACKGEIGTVMPQLNAGGKTGCQ